jgi:hypothetical protein
MVKFKTAAFDVPAFVTLAWVPGSPVVTVPTATVAAWPAAPAAPAAPAGPAGPMFGTTTFTVCGEGTPTSTALVFKLTSTL